MDTDKQRLNSVTEAIIGGAFAVSNALGLGFLEKVYEVALVVALRKAGLTVLQQVIYEVRHEGQIVGEYIADFVVKDAVLVELKAIKEFDSVHMAMCLNYLRASGLTLCLLINFGKAKVDVKRIVL